MTTEHCAYRDPLTTKGCVLEVDPGNLIVTSSEKAYCRFHLPQDMGGHVNSPRKSVNPKSQWTTGEITEFNESVASLARKFIDDDSVINFNGIVFPSNFSFTNFLGPGDSITAVTCRSALFYGDVDISQLSFQGQVIFNDAIIKKDFVINDTHFSFGLLLESIAVGGKLTLKSTAVEERFSLKRSRFGSLEIDNTYISIIFDVSNITIREDFIFNKNELRSIADATFENATIEGQSWLNLSSFKCGKVSFGGCKFKQGAAFRTTEFIGNVDFFADHLDSLDGPIDMTNTVFRKDVNFSGRKFPYGSSFQHCKFFGIPRFDNCEFHPSIELSEAEFLYLQDNAASAYRILRKLMEDRRDRISEGRFFVLEKRCERMDTSLSRVERFLSWFYDATSRYGQDASKPLLLIIVALLIFFFLYWTLFFVFASDSYNDFALKNISGFIFDLIEFTLSQIIRPFEIWSPRYIKLVEGVGNKVLLQAMNEIGLFLRLITSVQTIVIAGLINRVHLGDSLAFSPRLAPTPRHSNTGSGGCP